MPIHSGAEYAWSIIDVNWGVEHGTSMFSSMEKQVGSSWKELGIFGTENSDKHRWVELSSSLLGSSKKSLEGRI